MGSRQKAGDSLRLPAPSRRDVLSVAASGPAIAAIPTVACSTSAESDFLRRCAEWLVSDFETDRLARRWSALETLAASGYDYFRMTGPERRTLPMGPEMTAIEVQLDALWADRKRHFEALKTLKPRNIHEVASLLTIAARMDAHDPGATAPLVHQAITFLASAKCPACGEPYVPPSLPTA